jgi:hypothetical protein
MILRFDCDFADSNFVVLKQMVERFDNFAASIDDLYNFVGSNDPPAAYFAGFDQLAVLDFVSLDKCIIAEFIVVNFIVIDFISLYNLPVTDFTGLSNFSDAGFAD